MPAPWSGDAAESSVQGLAPKGGHRPEGAVHDGHCWPLLAIAGHWMIFFLGLSGALVMGVPQVRWFWDDLGCHWIGGTIIRSLGFPASMFPETNPVIWGYAGLSHEYMGV